MIDVAPQITIGELADRLGLRVPRAVRGVRITPTPCPPWKPPAEAPLTAAVVAALYGVSVQRVHQLDGALRPVRCACGTRLYSAADVERVAAERAVARARLREERRARALAQREGTYRAKGTGKVKGARR